jgi:hypothetical protein
VETARLDEQQRYLTKIFGENFEGEKKYTAVHHHPCTGARPTKLCRWRIMFVGTQYGTCLCHLWHLKFGSGLSIFGKFIGHWPTL